VLVVVLAVGLVVVVVFAVGGGVVAVPALGLINGSHGIAPFGVGGFVVCGTGVTVCAGEVAVRGVGEAVWAGGVAVCWLDVLRAPAGTAAKQSTSVEQKNRPILDMIASKIDFLIQQVSVRGSAVDWYPLDLLDRMATSP
jgi:hypothetical protein